jgi:uncharacterized protein (DUF697 family)
LLTWLKVFLIVHLTCAVCAVVAVIPIPIADFFILTSMQAFSAAWIASVRGVPIAESTPRELFLEVFGVIRMGFLAQWIALTVWKLITLPYFLPAAVITIPMVYTLTFVIMTRINWHFRDKAMRRRAA